MKSDRNDRHKDHRPTGPNQRMLRVGELVRHALAGLFARGEIQDELLAGRVLTVPEVRMSPDLKLANAYVMPLGGEQAAEIVAALNRHQRFIRGRIAPELDLSGRHDIAFGVRVLQAVTARLQGAEVRCL